MKEKEWYDDENLITSMLIGLLILIIILSQSFAIRNQLGLGFMVRSLLNYNSIYLIFLTYFILIKTKFGKRNFNICNVFLIIIQILVTLASLFNIFQGFHLTTIANFILNISLSCYMVNSLLKDTSLWERLHLDKIPFEKITNIQYFYIVSALAGLSLILGIFSSFSFDTVVLSLLEAMLMVGIARYLYLWTNYQEKRKQELEEIKKQQEDKAEQDKKEIKVKKQKTPKKKEKNKEDK